MEFLDYFQSYDDYFWEWENEILSASAVYETISISGGNTIAYENHVFEILEALSDGGIPPFGSFLLAMTATNHQPEQALKRVEEIVKKPLYSHNDAYNSTWTRAIGFLEKLAALPLEYKQENKRILLFRIIFSNCHNRLSPNRVKELLEVYKNDKNQLVMAGKKIPFSTNNFTKDFRTLSLLDYKFPTTEAIIAAFQGLPELPEIPEEILEQPAVKSTEDFMGELMKEPKTFQVASLVQRIWSGLNIPMHHTAPGGQPLGGISDLSNKGDFDKLLISEFAADDTVFMSRIANNEALYIKREVPPQSDDFVRILLIDSSLRNWGNPKVMAYASAIAIAKHPKTDIRCKVFVIGKHYDELHIESVDQVIEGLDLLSHRPDASEGLNAFLKEYKDISNSELFLIASDEALRTIGMQKAINDHYDTIKYLISTRSEGSIDFYSIRNKGRKHIQHLMLPLEALWEKRPAGTTMQKHMEKRKSEYGYPFNYPILFPLTNTVTAIFFLEGDYYVLTSSKTLYLATIDDGNRKNTELPYVHTFYKGGTILFENISMKSGGIYALGGNGEVEHLLLCFYPNDLLMTFLNLNTKQFFKTTFDRKGRNNVYRLAFVNHTFYLFDSETEEIWHIKIEDHLIIDPIGKDNRLKKEFEEQKAMVKKYEPRGGSILSNLTNIFIAANGSLYLNNHELKIFIKGKYRDDSVEFVINRNNIPRIKATFKDKKFIFPDGSKLLRDKRGIVTLESSNAAIPKIYIPTYINHNLGIATDTEFTGNDYFYDQQAEIGLVKVTIDEFNKKYLEPFISTIIAYGT